MVFSFTYLANYLVLHSNDTSGIKLTIKLHYICDSVDISNKISKKSVESLKLHKIAFYFEGNLLFSLEQHKHEKVFENKDVINTNVPVWKLSECSQKNNLRNYIQTYWEEWKVKKGIEDWQTAFNLDNKIIIPSYFFRVIMADANFFDNEQEINSYNRGLRDYLIEKNVKNHDTFLNEFLKFESMVINQILNLKFSNLFDLKEHDFNNTFQLTPLRLKEVFERDHFKSKESDTFYENIIKSINSPISNLVLTEILSNENDEDHPKVNFRTYLDKKFQPPNSKLAFFDIHIIVKLINWVIDESLKRFEYDLTQFIEEGKAMGSWDYPLPFVGQYEHIKSTFYEVDTISKNSILYKFGSYYFRFEAVKQMDFINKWLLDLNIAKELKLKATKNEDGKLISFTYKVILDNIETNIEDLGLGSRKLLLILMELAMNADLHYKAHNKYAIIGSILILEEPESNLHPSFQSQLSDIIVDAYINFNVRVIVETHSEYLIRKLQYLVASQLERISNNDIAIYYLYNPNQIPEGEDQIYKLDLREDGFMNNDFGSGFFDEASSLSLKLINSSNFN